MEIAKELLSKNKALDIDLLYTIAKRRLNLPRKGLISIIQYLLNKKILVEGSKYTRESVLANKNRVLIYEYITTNLGAHFSSIRKEAFPDVEDELKSIGQVVWHLEMLIKFKLIKKMNIGNYVIFLPIEIDEKEGLLHFFLNDAINEKILILLVKMEKVKRSDVYKLIDEKRENVYYRIKNLMEKKVVSFVEGSEKVIKLTSKYEELTRELLNKKDSLRNKMLTHGGEES